ncbi:unnamed protein product [Cylicocyclus nassatus]|uniref:Uncharacterized protein n=1 Tax=Cylicocyclus nassatus TaxID=53992 RepID=A0AA36GSF4_CYLNA|nr:unnamed protein product [Cylicocyclus nassatus]
MRITVGGGPNTANTTLTSRANPEERKEARINKYLIFAGIGSAVFGVLFLILLVCLQRSREKKRLLELAEIKHRRKRRRSHERKPKKRRTKAKKETLKTSGEEKKNGHEKLSAEALHSAPTPVEVPPDAPKGAASPPTATGGDYVNADDLMLDILTASTQADVDVQNS